jgi:hypothetical protein
MRRRVIDADVTVPVAITHAVTNTDARSESGARGRFAVY